MPAQTVFRATTGTVHAVSHTATETNGWRPSLVCGTRVRAGVEIMADTATVSCRTCRTRRGQANGPTASAMRLRAQLTSDEAGRGQGDEIRRRVDAAALDADATRTASEIVRTIGTLADVDTWNAADQDARDAVWARIDAHREAHTVNGSYVSTLIDLVDQVQNHADALAEDARRDAVLATAEHRVGDRVGIVRGVQSVSGPVVYAHGTVVRVTETWIGQVEYVVRHDDGSELTYRPYLLRAMAPAPVCDTVTVRADDVIPGDDTAVAGVVGTVVHTETIMSDSGSGTTVHVVLSDGSSWCESFRPSAPRVVVRYRDAVTRAHVTALALERVHAYMLTER